MKKKISILIGIVALISGICLGFIVVGPIVVDMIHSDINIIPQQNNQTENQISNETIPPVIPPIEPKYNDTFLFDQQTEQLDGEVVQYEITFHNDTDVQYDMDISYKLTSTGSVFYLIYLTDGKNTTTLHISDEKYSKFIDITTFRKHRKIGKNANAEGETSLSNSIQITKNTTWHLTIAVARNINESISVAFNTNKECMEIKSLGRKDSVTLVSALNSDYKNGKFVGRYKGYSLFGLGVSHCSVNKEIPVSNGGIICVDMFNHEEGMLKVKNPSGYLSRTSYKSENTSILLSTTNNNSKSWIIEAQSFGFPMKTSILAFVVDVNPYSSISYNDWNGTMPMTISDKIDNIATKLFNYGLNGIIKFFTKE